MVKSKNLPSGILYDEIADQILMPEDFYLNVAQGIGRLPSSTRLLDIGCGNGYLLEKIARLNPEVKLFGLDFSEKLLKNAKKRLGGKVKLVRANALALPFAGEEFDIVIISEVIEHLEDPTGGLIEANRVLKRGGRLVLTFPNASSYRPFYPFVKKLPRGKIRFIFTPPEDEEKTGQPIDRCYSYDGIISLLKKTGFKIKKVSGTVFFHYLGEVPILSSLIIFLWRKTPFDKVLNRVLGPKWAYRVLAEATK